MTILQRLPDWSSARMAPSRQMPAAVRMRRLPRRAEGGNGPRLHATLARDSMMEFRVVVTLTMPERRPNRLLLSMLQANKHLPPRE